MYFVFPLNLNLHNFKVNGNEAVLSLVLLLNIENSLIHRTFSDIAAILSQQTRTYLKGWGEVHIVIPRLRTVGTRVLIPSFAAALSPSVGKKPPKKTLAKLVSL